MRGHQGRGVALFAANDPADALHWVEVDARAGRMLAHGRADGPGDLPIAPGARAILVLPGTEAHVRRVALPARTQAQARAGAAYAFEGLLAHADDAHYALGATQDNAGHRLVAAISGARLNAWLEACERLRVEPTRVFVDFTLLTPDANAVEIVAQDDRALVAGGRYGGFAMEAPLAGAVLGRWLSESGGDIREISVSDALHGVIEIASPASVPVLPRPAQDTRAMLALAAFSAPAIAPDLRQGAFALKGKERKPLNLLGLALMLAIIAALTQIGANALAGWRDANAARALVARAEADFRAAHPNVKRIVDLNAQARAFLNARTAARGHPVLKSADALYAAQQKQAGVRLEALRHTAPGRSVQAVYSATTPQELDTLIAVMRADGLAVSPGAMRAEQARYVMDIAVEVAP
jgi:general secretion pathway protein L